MILGIITKQKEETAESVADKKYEDGDNENDEDDDGDVGRKNPYKSSEVHEAMDVALSLLDYIDDTEAHDFYTQVRELRGLIIHRQYSQKKQVKIHNFFKLTPK